MNTAKVLKEINAGRMTEIRGSAIVRHSTDTGLLTRTLYYIGQDKRVIQLETEATGVRYGVVSATRRVSEVKGADLLRFQARFQPYFADLFGAAPPVTH